MKFQKESSLRVDVFIISIFKAILLKLCFVFQLVDELLLLSLLIWFVRGLLLLASLTTCFPSSSCALLCYKHLCNNFGIFLWRTLFYQYVHTLLPEQRDQIDGNSDYTCLQQSAASECVYSVLQCWPFYQFLLTIRYRESRQKRVVCCLRQALTLLRHRFFLSAQNLLLIAQRHQLLL